eukprot:SAG31_NODE_926_length_10930_cov_135.691626_8_plen_158_part_00
MRRVCRHATRPLFSGWRRRWGRLSAAADHLHLDMLRCTDAWVLPSIEGLDVRLQRAGIPADTSAVYIRSGFGRVTVTCSSRKVSRAALAGRGADSCKYNLRDCGAFASTPQDYLATVGSAAAEMIGSADAAWLLCAGTTAERPVGCRLARCEVTLHG